MRLLALALTLALPFAAATAPAALANKPKKGKPVKVEPAPDPAIVAMNALDPQLSAAIDAALAGAQRADADRARDQYRNPKASLAFWGFRPDMTVIEVSPGGGYWTEILAPLMSDKGTLLLGTLNTANPVGRGLANLTKMLADDPKTYGRTRLAMYMPSAAAPIAAPGSADMVLVARHLHGLANANLTDNAMKMYFDVLKSGGVLAVEQHRWPADKPGFGTIGINPQFKISGYLPEAQVIAMAEKAGFKLAGRSEINANPKDDHDHPFGVWTLPPGGWSTPNGQGSDPNFDRKPFDAVGESDRMTLRFVKP
jgi:predicted methyltransferase